MYNVNPQKRVTSWSNLGVSIHRHSIVVSENNAYLSENCSNQRSIKHEAITEITRISFNSIQNLNNTLAAFSDSEL